MPRAADLQTVQDPLVLVEEVAGETVALAIDNSEDCRRHARRAASLRARTKDDDLRRRVAEAETISPGAASSILTAILCADLDVEEADLDRLRPQRRVDNAVVEHRRRVPDEALDAEDAEMPADVVELVRRRVSAMSPSIGHCQSTIGKPKRQAKTSTRACELADAVGVAVRDHGRAGERGRAHVLPGQPPLREHADEAAWVGQRCA